MIEVRYLGRLGNNLFQYSLGRIIAEETGCSLSAVPIPGFPNTNLPIRGNNFDQEFEYYSGFRLPLEEILSNPRTKGIILRGYFQRSEYYRPYKTRINNWLQFEKRSQTYGNSIVDKDTLVVNVRRTDYISNGWALPFSYYERAIQLLHNRTNKVVIITDDPADPFFLRFRKYKPIFFKAPAIEQLRLMSRSNFLIMSQSTFSWWGNFLSQEQVAICPRPTFGCWGRNNDLGDISLIDGNGFVIIDCEEQYTPTLFERCYHHGQIYLASIKRRIKNIQIKEPTN
jgi:hypothetical protein